LDRKQQRKIKEWDKYHADYVTKFKERVDEAKAKQGSEQRLYSPDAFNNYLWWFLKQARVEILKPAFDEDISEEPVVFDDLA